MKKTKVEPSEESSGMLSENRLIRSDQKGAESDHNGWVYVMGNGQMIPGLEMAPKVFKIIYNVELGKLVRQEVTLYNCLCATPSVWGNPTEVCADCNHWGVKPSEQYGGIWKSNSNNLLG